MSYVITETTMAIIPGRKTKILDGKQTISILDSPKEIVSRSCKLNGSTLEGRQKGSAYLIGSSYKPPVIVNEEDHIIFIPTHSIRNDRCAWLSLKHILCYYPKQNKVFVEFRNHEKILLDISYEVLDRQILRATRLELILNGRNYTKHL